MAVFLEDYISGGYLITQFIDASDPNRWMRELFGATEDLLPDRILSVGYCGTKFAPLAEWTGATAQDYADFGIPQQLISELNTWTNQRFGQEIGYPHMFFRLSTAYEYIDRFVQEAPEIQLLGMGVHKNDLHRIDEAARLRPSSVAESGAQMAGFIDGGFGQAIQLAEHPAQGEVLGFDVIACGYQIEHSWHCNGLAKDGLEEFGFRPNSFGLIDDKTNADKLATYANERLIEDCIWLPALVTRYPSRG